MPKRKRAPETRASFIHRTGKKSKVIYLDESELATISQAADLLGVSASQFIVTASAEKAKRVVRNKE